MSNEAKQRKAVMKALRSIPTYTDGLPLAEFDQILTSNGFRPLEPAIYCGRDGQCHEQVGERSWFTFTWHKMEHSGKYEIVAYIS